MNFTPVAFRAATLLPYVEPLPFDPYDLRRHGCYPHQLDLLQQVVDRIRQGYRRILIQLPTGGGKTKLATALLASADCAQFIVHRKELIEQTSRAFWRAGLAHSFVAAGKPFEPDAALLLAGIATLAERLGVVLPPEMAVWDEAHHLNASTWAEAMAAYPDALHIGLTATPQRLDGRGLGDHFETMVLGPSVKWLIAEGYLSDFDYYGPPPVDEDDDALLGDVVDHYQRFALGEQGIVFASSRDHSRALAEEFRRRGVSALHVDGSMSAAKREEADRLFRSGEVQVETNVNLFGEGYDVPNIGYVGLARRTQSLSWFLQMVGRALRVAPGKTRAVICDHGNNWFHHGMPDDDRAWTLDGRLKGSGPGGCNADAEPIHQCLQCYLIVKSFIKVCSRCGTPFPVKSRNMRLRAGELVKIERAEAREGAEAARKAAERARKSEERACAGHGELVQLARSRGYKNPEGWARLRMSFRSSWKGAA
jgi:superfamily II DNA or RNA helicase